MRSAPARQVPRSRDAFSLMELILVLALLAVLTALVMPALEKPFANERLKKGADQVRMEWTRARVRAMSSGVTLAFRFTPEAGTYTLENWGGLEAEVEAADVTAYGTQAAPAKSYGAGPAQPNLPDGVVFVSGSLIDNRAISAVPPATAGGDPTAVAMSDPIYFYPDGTTSTARLLLRNEHELYIVLDLRGLTGITTVSDLLSDDEVPQ